MQSLRIVDSLKDTLSKCRALITSISSLPEESKRTIEHEFHQSVTEIESCVSHFKVSILPFPYMTIVTITEYVAVK